MKQTACSIVPTLLMGVLVVVSSSCSSYSSLSQPITKSIPESLKKGDKVRLILTSGVTTEKMIVEQVWQDSIKMVSDARAIPIAHIAQIRKRKVDPVLTTVAIVLPIAVLVILTVQAAEHPFGY